jgi:NTE family protein
MIGKITSEMISRRWALSLLGAFGFVAAPTVLRPSNAEAQTAGAAPGRRKVALALQGGGSHGAFTWGVLDRLLEDTTIDIVGVTGTSAGAMNGAVLVDGLVRGGSEQARAELRRYWEGVGAMPGFGSFFSNMSGEEAARTSLESIPAYVEAVKKNLSPYDLPASNDNPMRRLFTERISIACVCKTKFSSPCAQPTPVPRDGASSLTKTSRSMLCWLQRACRSSFAP